MIMTTGINLAIRAGLGQFGFVGVIGTTKKKGWLRATLGRLLPAFLISMLGEQLWQFRNVRCHPSRFAFRQTPHLETPG